MSNKLGIYVLGLLTLPVLVVICTQLKLYKQPKPDDVILTCPHCTNAVSRADMVKQ